MKRLSKSVNEQEVQLIEQAAPGTPSTGYGLVYVKTDGKVYFKNDGGTEYDLTATGGGGGTSGNLCFNAVIDFGTLGDTSKTYILTAVGVTPTTKCIASLSHIASASLGRDPDEISVDPISVVCKPGTDQITIHAGALNGRVLGKYLVDIVTDVIVAGTVGGTGGVQSLNSLTLSNQTLVTGTTGSDFNIDSTTSTHTFNIPNAGASARGVVSTGTQTIAGLKTFSDGVVSSKKLTAGVVALTDGASIAVDASLGNHFRVTLGGNRTIAVPSNPTDGQKIIFELIQDATGTRTITFTGGAGGFAYGTDITGVTLTTTANKRDFVGAVYNSTANLWYIIAFTKGY